MAIKLPDDIKLMASERMDDTDEGGGRMTGNEIVGGQTNNIFPDISRLDRTYGKVSLRKVYAACLSDNQDTYYGAHVIITDPPDDPNIKCTIFTTDSSTDRRADAQDKVESFIVEGSKYIGYLWGTHLEGMRTLSIVQPIDQPPPEVGDVLCLKESNYRQFVRILEQSYEDKTFVIQSSSSGTLTVRRRIVTVKVSPQLKYDFHGADISELTFPPCPSEIKRTVPTDRTDFYSVATLIEAANEGDLTIHVDSIFNEIVPAGRSETALPDATLASEIGTGFDGTENYPATVTINTSGNIQSGYRIELGRPIKPLSLSVRLGNHTPWQDDGHNNLLMGDNIEGYVDYKEGVIELNDPSVTGSGTITITFIQATLRIKTAYSDSVPVTISNQSFTWIFSLYPLPERDSVIVDFRSQQRWYRMIDDGNGSLKPLIEGTGAGTIDYATGTVTLSTQALPDIDSEILIYWNHPAEQYEEEINSDDILYFEIETQNKGIARNSLTITWEVDGQQKTATDDGSGNLTGDATGKVSYSDGLIWLTPLVLPDPGVEFTIEYNYGDPIVETFSAPARDGDGWLNLQLSSTPIAEHTVKVEFQACTDYMRSRTSSYTHDHFYKYAWYKNPQTTSEERSFSYTADLKACITAFWYDNGSGKLVSPDGTVTNSNIDYTNGTVSFLPDFNARFRFFAGVSSESNYSAEYKRYTYEQDKYGWTNSWKYNTLATANLTCVFPPEGSVKVSYYSTDGTNFASETVAPNLTINVSSGYRRRIVDGGLIFTLDGTQYWLSRGQIYRYVDDNLNIEGVGTCETDIGDVHLQVWGIKNRSINVTGLIKSTIDVYPTTELTFRVPGVVKPTSLILNITYIDGQNEIVTADATGEINGSRVVGYINYNTGVVKLWFGEWLSSASDYVNEEWYDPENVNENDEVWAPFAIDVEAFRYSAVLYSYIPFDPEIIGLDPTRLPPDGRVPIFRDGFVAVVHNTKSEQLPNDLQPGQQIQLSRGNLTYCDLYDYNGVYVDPNLYTVDLENGIITMADPLDLSDYTQPLTAVHRIEDMKRISRVDISGRITFSSPLENSYTANDTYVSSALICGSGDLQGRVINIFDQKTWTGEWSDSRIGDPCTANYNSVDYPITTTNKGAIKERWAIIFTSDTDFKVVGETVGEIAYGNTATDCAPINPATGVPYFYIRHEGWGSGWASGNVLRFNTEAAHYPIWCVRTILPGKAVYDEDSFTLQIRGDAH